MKRVNCISIGERFSAKDDPAHIFPYFSFFTLPEFILDGKQDFQAMGFFLRIKPAHSFGCWDHTPV